MREVISFDKKNMSEEDIKNEIYYFCNWTSRVEHKKYVRAEYTFTDGIVIVRGNLTSRGKKKRAEYIIFYRPNIPLALI